MTMDDLDEADHKLPSAFEVQQNSRLHGYALVNHFIQYAVDGGNNLTLTTRHASL
jgi:hypothetical protein